MKTNQEIVEEFKSMFNKLGRFANGAVIYGESGDMTFSKNGCQIEAIHDYVRKILEQKDREWREKMFEVLQSIPFKTRWLSTKKQEKYIEIGELEEWQQDQINKLKDSQ